MNNFKQFKQNFKNSVLSKIKFILSIILGYYCNTEFLFFTEFFLGTEKNSIYP